MSPTRPSATPTSCTWIGHANAFFRCTRWLSTFHRGARPVFTRPSQSERSRERDLSSKPLSFSKERMRESERERERERASMTGESIVAHASVGHTSSRSATCLHNLLPSWSKRAEERDLFSTAFSSSKKDFERSSMTGESSRKNLNILQAEAEKLSGFTPSIIQPEAAGRGLYARCKTR